MSSHPADARRTQSLPTPTSPLVGRAREIEAAHDRLRQPATRLLTLTGPGGIGKTRLALEVAAGLADDFEDGVAFVDLAVLMDPSLVLSTVARTLGVRETGEEPLSDSLKRALRERELLLVLDSFEQVLEAAPRITELLTACAQLKVLVTSRTTLHLSGENELPVPPLALPEAASLTDLDAAARCDAVALFVQRARATVPDFALTAENVAAVVEICQRLDGLPLAVELAATRVKLLPPPVLLTRLGNRLQLLTGGMRDLPARQQTLRAAIDWSYRLLDPEQQALFARLAVFVGGWTLDDAERVCGGTRNEERGTRDDGISLVPRPSPLDTLDGLAALVDQSLVWRQEDGRFGMLETLREYALERLAASGEAETLRRQHASCFLALAERVRPDLTGPWQGERLAQLEREHDNLRAALGWALDRGESEMGMRLAASLARFWEVRGHLSEGQRWLDRALERCTEALMATRADALTGAGSLAYIRGDLARSWELHQEGLALRRELGDRAGIAMALHNLSTVRLYQGDLAVAKALCEESLALRRELGDRRGIALSLNSLAVMARNRKEYDAARAIFGECVTIFRELGDRWGTGLLLNNMARMERDLGAWDRALALCTESLTLFRELGDRHGVAWVLSNLAIVAQRRHALERSARLFGAAEMLVESLGSATISLSPAERAAYEEAIAGARANLGAVEFEAARAAGRALSLDEAAQLAVSDTVVPGPGSLAAVAPGPTTSLPSKPVARAPSASRPDPLTRREREVAALVARGLTDRQVASELVIAEGTVGVHLDHIFGKLGIRSRAQLAAWAVERGLAT